MIYNKLSVVIYLKILSINILCLLDLMSNFIQKKENNKNKNAQITPIICI